MWSVPNCNRILELRTLILRNIWIICFLNRCWSIDRTAVDTAYNVGGSCGRTHVADWANGSIHRGYACTSQLPCDQFSAKHMHAPTHICINLRFTQFYSIYIDIECHIGTTTITTIITTIIRTTTITITITITTALKVMRQTLLHLIRINLFQI
jgi:hypothetical protein